VAAPAATHHEQSRSDGETAHRLEQTGSMHGLVEHLESFNAKEVLALEGRYGYR
jgi:hypothetical protein